MENRQGELIPQVGDELELKVSLEHWRGIAIAAATPGQRFSLLRKSFPNGVRVYSSILQLLDHQILKLRVERVLPEGVIDCTLWMEDDHLRERTRIFLDGREIHQVWYADRHAGIVKTYDILDDGQMMQLAAGKFDPAQFPGMEVEMVRDGLVLSKTLHGKVEFKPVEGQHADSRTDAGTK